MYRNIFYSKIFNLFCQRLVDVNPDPPLVRRVSCIQQDAVSAVKDLKFIIGKMLDKLDVYVFVQVFFLIYLSTKQQNIVMTFYQ